MVKFEGKIGTLYQIFTPCFLKNSPHDVQTKGGGVKGLLNNVKKNCTFLSCRLPLHASSSAAWQMIVRGRFSAPAWQTSSLPGVTRDFISFFESIFVNLYPFL